MKAKLERGEAVIGLTLLGNWPEVVEILGYLGLDYVWFDGQHGVLGLPEMAGLVRAAEVAGITPLARVPRNAPDVNTKEEAEAVVRAAKFYPEGMRGLGYGHFAEYFARRSMGEVLGDANNDTSVIVQCESTTGMDNLAEIVRVPGVDVVMLGPMDLSQSMGIPGQFDNPLHKEAMARGRRTVIEAGKAVGEIGWDGDYARTRMAEGVGFINLGVNDLLIAGVRDYLDKARGESKG